MPNPDIDFTSEYGKRALERLQGEQVIWLTTTRADGTPQPSPVWFLWHDGSVLIYSQPDTAKLRAIARNPHVFLNFNATPSGGDVGILQGTAEIAGDVSPATGIPAYVEKYLSGIKEIGMTPEAFASSYSVPIRFTPTRMRGW